MAHFLITLGVFNLNYGKTWSVFKSENLKISKLPLLLIFDNV